MKAAENGAGLSFVGVGSGKRERRVLGEGEKSSLSGSSEWWRWEYIRAACHRGQHRRYFKYGWGSEDGIRNSF